MLTNNKHLVIQDLEYNSNYIDPYIYEEKRFWSINTAYIDGSYDDKTKHVTENEYNCYYKINPYDLDNMEYSSQEVLTNFHRKNTERKCDKYWGGNFEYTYGQYNNLVVNYNNKIMEKEN